MIIVQCDGCYKQLPTPVMGEMMPKEITVLGIVERSSIIACDRIYKQIHLCPNCKTSRRTLYFDNPYFQEPPEDAQSEKKAAQSS